MFERIAAEPFWLQAWIYWMVFLNSASVLFVSRAEGRWALLAWVANLVTMDQLFQVHGYARILGLSHVIFWSPLVVYLFRRRAGFGTGVFGGWARWLLATNAVSLAIDYVDVARWALGDRAPV